MATPNTPLQFMGTGFRFISWETASPEFMSLAYRVLAPVTGVLFSSPDLAQPDAPTFAVTDHETERARYWLASVDHPSVRPTLDIRLRADPRLTLPANGEAQPEELHADGTKTAHFVQSVGCPSYLVCFAAGDFVRWDGGEFQGLPIAAFAPRPFTVEHLQRSFGRTREMLGWRPHQLGLIADLERGRYFTAAAA